MKECHLKQAGLAEVMGVSIDRVKSLTSGKVQKLAREEGAALVTKLHIRGDWLVTGEGEMFQSEREVALAALEAGQAEMSRQIQQARNAGHLPAAPEARADIAHPPAPGPGMGGPKSDWREIMVMVIELKLPERNGWSWEKTVRVVDYLHYIEEQGMKLTHDVVNTIIKRMP